MNCPEFVKKHAEETEEIIMKWAEEHPVQTNEDKFEEVFGFKPSHRCMFNNLCPECIVFGEKDCIEAWWNEEYKAPTEEVSE